MSMTKAKIKTAMPVKMRNTAKISRKSKLIQNKANVRSKIVGARGRRVSIPRSANSFKSRTDNT